MYQTLTVQQLEWAMGDLHQTARLVTLKSRLMADDMIRGRVASDVQVAGPVDECPCCGKMVAEGVLH